MRLKKASAWYYNKGTTNVVVNELGITLPSKVAVDLFQFNPSLTWEQYNYSVTSGVLSQKTDKLIHLPGPPDKYKNVPVVNSETIIPLPVRSRARTALQSGKDREDYLATIESEFPAGDQPVPQEELWRAERDKYLGSLSNSEQGENGEVFSDNLFDEEYLPDLTD